MKNTLIDAGPLIALFNKNDRYHARAVEFLKDYSGKLTTSWPVITEASHILGFSVHAQIDLLSWIRSGGIDLAEIAVSDVERIIELSRKYADVPMDLADASLIVLSERTGVKEIITIDSDYYIYRTIYKEMLTNVFLR